MLIMLCVKQVHQWLRWGILNQYDIDTEADIQPQEKVPLYWFTIKGDLILI